MRASLQQLLVFENHPKKYLSTKAAGFAIRGFLVSFVFRTAAPTGGTVVDTPLPLSSVIQITCARRTLRCITSIISANLISFSRVSESYCSGFLHPTDAGPSGP
jgi:hypothetical protein